MEYNRLYFIERLIKAKKYKTYLEIGVFLGKVFFYVSANKKFAVDPEFRFGTYRRIKRVFKKLNNLWARFYEKKSDDFFAEDAAAIFSSQPLDICLVDGMHEYGFALRDVENALKHLQKDGVIIMHDCNPAKEEDSISFEDWKKRNFTGFWNGDVWKSVLHLRSMCKDINVFVLNCDHGLGVVTFGVPENPMNFTGEEIENFTYADLEKNREQWLNLKDPSYFFEYFKISRD